MNKKISIAIFRTKAIHLKVLVLMLLNLTIGCDDSLYDKNSSVSVPSRGPRYIYSHVYLRESFFANPERVISSLNIEGSEYLRSLWINEVKGDEASSKQIDYKKIESNSELHIITSPKPIDLTDAYFICLTIKDGKPRYFTVEKTFKYKDTGDALLCEWTQQGAHRNFGLSTSNPTVETFAEIVKEILNKGL
jgi:hypothetical protein